MALPPPSERRGCSAPCMTPSPRRRSFCRDRGDSRGLRRGCGVLGARAGEDILQSVVALVAGVFVNHPARRAEFVFTAPGLGPDAGVFDLELIQNAAFAHASKSLRHLEIFP